MVVEPPFRDQLSRPRLGQLRAAVGLDLHLAANGIYEYSGYMQSSMYHCTIVVFRWQRGTIAADGGQLTLTPREGKLYYKDSCRAGSEKEKAVVDEPARYGFTMETEGTCAMLAMKKPSGEDWGKFYRK